MGERYCARCDLPIHLYLASWVDDLGYAICPLRPHGRHQPPALEDVLRELVQVALE